MGKKAKKRIDFGFFTGRKASMFYRQSEEIENSLRDIIDRQGARTDLEDSVDETLREHGYELSKHKNVELLEFKQILTRFSPCGQNEGSEVGQIHISSWHGNKMDISLNHNKYSFLNGDYPAEILNDAGFFYPMWDRPFVFYIKNNRLYALISVYAED